MERKSEAIATDRTDSTALPSISVFDETWTSFTHDGLRGRTSTEKKAELGNLNNEGQQARMVVGIFTRLHPLDTEYRAVIRRTWMTQPGICTLESWGDPPPDCFAFVTFVVGNRSGLNLTWWSQKTKESRNVEPDLLALPIPENMDCGKTQAWFEFAAREYRNATHIAKMDMDAFVDSRRLRPLLEHIAPDCPYVYGGRPLPCPPELCPWRWGACGILGGIDSSAHEGAADAVRRKRQRGPQRRRRSEHRLSMLDARQDARDPICWSYMQGGFYFMSRPLALRVASPSGWWRRRSESCLPEDAVAGEAVDTFNRTEEGSCVSTLNLLGQGVIWHADRAIYWIDKRRQPD